MTDKEIILSTLTFLKTEGDNLKDGVEIKDYFQKFEELEETDWERIRDRLVINEYASFPTQGDQWKLSITWHPNGGVDLLKKPKWVIDKNGNLKNIYKGWKLLVKHSVAITLSVIGGLILFFFTDIVIKPRLLKTNQDVPTNRIDSINYSTPSTNTEPIISATSEDSTKLEQTRDE